MEINLSSDSEGMPEIHVYPTTSSGDEDYDEDEDTEVSSTRSRSHTPPAAAPLAAAVAVPRLSRTPTSTACEGVVICWPPELLRFTRVLMAHIHKTLFAGYRRNRREHSLYDWFTNHGGFKIALTAGDGSLMPPELLKGLDQRTAMAEAEEKRDRCRPWKGHESMKKKKQNEEGLEEKKRTARSRRSHTLCPARA